MKQELIHPMDETFQDYLIDESKMTGWAESISFPQSEAEIARILRVMRENGTPVTIQGGKTGVVGSAVPLGGHIMNLSRMKKVQSFSMTETGEAFLKVEPGITLGELRKALQRRSTPEAFFWPPDPSEPTATVGGIASTDARGLCLALYGKTAQHIAGLRVINARGSLRDLKRGRDAVVIHGASRDLLDVYLGGEGMYGVITELTLRLLPKPKETWGIAFFFDTRVDGIAFAERLGGTPVEGQGARIAAMEYLDHTLLRALEQHPGRGFGLSREIGRTVPASTMVYVEMHGERETAMQQTAQTLMDLGSRFNNDPDNTWAFSGEPEIDKMRGFLHAAAETAILQIEKARRDNPGITKLGLDMSLEPEGLRSLISRLEKELEKKSLKACFWGHMGDSRLHVDILPRNHAEFIKGKTLLETWAGKFPAAIGNAVRSYGIGKLKKSIFLKTASTADIDDIIQLKKQLDEHRLWNPGNMLEP